MKTRKIRKENQKVQQGDNEIKESSRRESNRMSRAGLIEIANKARFGYDTVHLQGIGRVKAKRARDFRVGDKMAWNYGYDSEVVRIVGETACFITFEVTVSDGSTTHRKFGKDRLVAIG